MQVIQAVNGTFHHFDLARELESRGHLKRIYSSFPWRRLRREGVSRDRVSTFPWIHTPFILASRYWRLPEALGNHLGYSDSVIFDRWVSSRIEACDVFVGLSGGGLVTGQLVQKRGGKFVCDRGSSHIRYQNLILTEEYRRWGVEIEACYGPSIEREEAEYHAADAITVPSGFARRSFLEMGVPAEKVVKIPYGVRLERFQPTQPPPADNFEVLFAGTVNLRKGFPYLVQAFQMLKHPKKRLRLVGPLGPEAKAVLARLNLIDVEVLGAMPQMKLAEYMSASHVMVLPSIEEGLALVQAQAMACGCPLISSTNTGAEDLFVDGVGGFLVPIRSPEAIHDRLEQLAADPDLQKQMSRQALLRVQSIGGWRTYGDEYSSFLKALTT
jgi:glycosyltransferase involved in cell wall biosynthesis